MGALCQEKSMKIVAFLMLITAVTYAQVPASRTSKSDAQKIATAMQAYLPGHSELYLVIPIREWVGLANSLHDRRNAIIPGNSRGPRTHDRLRDRRRSKGARP